MNKPGTIIIQLTEEQQKELIKSMQKWKNLSERKKFVENNFCVFCRLFHCGNKAFPKIMTCPLYVQKKDDIMTCCGGDWWRWKAAGNEGVKRKYAKKIYLRIKKVLKKWRVI